MPLLKSLSVRCIVLSSITNCIFFAGKPDSNRQQTTHHLAGIANSSYHITLANKEHLRHNLNHSQLISRFLGSFAFLSFSFCIHFRFVYLFDCHAKWLKPKKQRAVSLKIISKKIHSSVWFVSFIAYSRVYNRHKHKQQHEHATFAPHHTIAYTYEKDRQYKWRHRIHSLTHSLTHSPAIANTYTCKGVRSFVREWYAYRKYADIKYLIFNTNLLCSGGFTTFFTVFCCWME